MAKGGTLKVRVVGDASNFRRTLDKAQGKVSSFGKKFGAAAKKVAKVGAAAFAAAGAAAIGGAFKVAEFGDEVAKSARKAGLGVEQFQELRFAFGQAGVEASTFDTAVQKFNKRLGESATTGGTADEAFKSLGVSLRDADGNVRDASGAMDEVLPKLADIESDAERAAVAGDLFGQRAGPELAAALADGAGGIEDARKKAQELGIVMDEDATEAAEKFSDQWDDLKQSALGLMRKGLTPVMGVLSDKVFPFLQKKVIPALSDFRDWLGPKLKAAAAEIVGLFKRNVLPILADFSDWWDDNGPMVTRWAQKIGDFLAKNWRPVLAGLATVIAAALVPAVTALVASIAALFSPVALIVGGLAALTAGLTYAYNNSETFRKVVDTAFTKVGEIVSSVIDAVQAIIERFVAIATTVWAKWGEGILSFAVDTWNNVRQVISGVLDVVHGIFETFAGLFSGDWDRMWAGIRQVFSGVWDIIAGTFRQVLNVLGTLLEAAMSTIGGIWVRTWDGIKGFFTDTWDSMVTGAKSSINSIIGFINGLIRAWNNFSLGMDSKSVDLGPLGSFDTPGFTIGTPDLPTIPRLAEGGIAKERTLAMLGEGGSDEAILPLNDRTFRSLGREIGREIAQASDNGGGLTIHGGIHVGSRDDYRKLLHTLEKERLTAQAISATYG